MHISDMLRQYNRNVSNGTEELRSVQGTQKLVSTAGDLSAGSVFEGTVNSVKGGKVTLALGNGQVITARLEGKVDMKPGTAMFFQVKSNDGMTVSIRPYSGVGNAGNPILLDALTAAQVPVTERTLAMVDAMMQEQMPVDRKSILEMAKLVNANPDANVQTIVQMTKLGLPVTEAMATQFEQYLSDRHALLNEMELMVNQMAETFGDETLTPEESFGLYSKLLDIFTENGMQQAAAPGADTAVSQTQQQNIPGREMGLQDAVQPGVKDAFPLHLEGTQAAQGETLGGLLSETQLETLGKALQDIPVLTGNPILFVNDSAEEIFVDTMQDDSVPVPGMAEAAETAEGAESAENNANIVKTVLNKDMPVTEFLYTLRDALAENEAFGFHGVPKLLAGKEFQMLLRSLVEQQWLIKPQDLKEEQRITKLYEKMERQLGQMETAIKAAGITQNSFLQTAADIRGNIEFMNQMNQIYNYVQIPLKMSGQNANGELYVYTNKKQLHDPEAELTAFLHLEMDQLGETDVSVRMKDKQVKTNFYFEDDASYRLVEKHLPVLERRLKSKGYYCTVTITNEKRNVNFKENFVKKGKAMAGSVHRYSFDVRA